MFSGVYTPGTPLSGGRSGIRGRGIYEGKEVEADEEKRYLLGWGIIPHVIILDWALDGRKWGFGEGRERRGREWVAPVQPTQCFNPKIATGLQTVDHASIPKVSSF